MITLLLEKNSYLIGILSAFRNSRKSLLIPEQKDIFYF